MSYLEDIVDGPSGTKIVVERIIRECEANFHKNGDWESPTVRKVVDFLNNCVRDCEHFTTAIGVSAILLKAANSDYLLFDNNLVVLSEFFKKVSPRIDAPNAKRNVEAMLVRFKSRQPFAPSSKHSNAIEDILIFADPLGMTPESGFLPLLVKEVDWKCAAVTSYLRGKSDNMKMGASVGAQDDTHNVIEKMVLSNYVFLGDNLGVLNFFIHQVGPALDGMAPTGSSWKLTESLDHLRLKSQEEPEAVREYVGSIRRNQGRPSIDSWASSPVDIEGLTSSMSRMANDLKASTSDEESDKEGGIVI
jgi:hypothetical protein